MAGYFGKAGTVAAWQSPEQGVIMDRHKQVTGVVGIGRGAGATFTAMGLALKMAEMTGGVTFTEGMKPGEGERGAYRVLAVDRHFEKKKSTGVSTPGTRINLYHKVNWAVNGPDFQGTEETEFRNFPGNHIIVDSPRAIEDMDILVCVVDPLPSRIMAGLEIFCRIKEQSLVPVIWVLNKNNSGVSRRETEIFLRTRFTHAIPAVAAETICRAEYNCTLPYYGHGAEEAWAALGNIAEEILMHN